MTAYETVQNAASVEPATSISPQSEDILLSVRGLRIEANVSLPGQDSRNVTIVDGVSFTLGKGKVLGLIGESGAGKSTIGLASMAYGRGACEITGGQVLLNGEDILQQKSGRIRELRGAKVAYVAQSAAAAFNPAHRLEDQVIESALEHGLMSRAEAKLYSIDLFTQLGLPDPSNFGKRYPHQVSGGQLQRAMTAMALCSAPDLIIFDEPTTALDVTTQIDVLAAIKYAINRTGTAALYITHDLAVVAQIADDIMVLRHGQMVEYGTTQQIITQPQMEYTRKLVSVRSTHKEEQAELAEEPVLQVDHITAAYGTSPPMLKDVSLHLYRGQTLAVVGESGSGKSTLARVITGLLRAQKGVVRFSGDVLPLDMARRGKAQLRRLQMIYQMADTSMNPRQTIGQIIGRPLELYFGIKGSARRLKVVELLKLIELDESFFDRYPAELSGGQKQRVSIARALAADPEVIICDEVTSALDPLVADEILKLLMRLQKQTGVAYLFITHDIATVRAIADSVAVMYQGNLIRFGQKTTVLSPPFDAYTELLLSSVPEMKLGWLDEVLNSRAVCNSGMM